MLWIFLTVGAQFLNAIVALVDKHILTDKRALPKPFVYAFYTCLISGSWIVIYLIGLLPLPELAGAAVPSFSDIRRPTLEVVALSVLAAYTFFIALVSMFTALREADTSDVVPVIGAVSALGSFGLGYFFLDANLSSNFIWGIVFLATGTFFVSRLRFPWQVAMHSLHSGLFFALHYVSLKGLFLTTSFGDGFFWSRISLTLFALSLLLVPLYYEMIREQTSHTTARAGALVLGNKMLAGIASILILKATDLGDVAVVQALGGLQFVFILIIGAIAGTTFGEHNRPRDLRQKILFVAVISVGFLVLFM